MPTRLAAPHHWLDDVAVALDAALVGASVAGVVSGPGWISAKIGDQFVWLIAHSGERMVFATTAPVSRRWLDLLQRHHKSPFPTHLSGRTLASVEVLETADGQADGLRMNLDGLVPTALNARFFPRPGALWVTGAEQTEMARLGRMEGPLLSPRPPRPTASFDAATHARLCLDVLATRLRSSVQRRVTQDVEQKAKKSQRLVWTLEGDLKSAGRDHEIRARADLLAAHLHEVNPGQSELATQDFDGEPVTIELDPALPAHVNLERWYKRAGRAQRKTARVEQRLEEAREQLDTAVRLRDALNRVETDASLEHWLAFADEHALPVVPSAPKLASQRGRPDPTRLPYWKFAVDDVELRVGRSARDNDELLARHTHPRDLWLHAQGVAGSHVIVRSGGRELPSSIVEIAARVAAHHSRARTSSVAPVLVTERRYVRKPRKAAPGQVTTDRAKTLFVEPGIPSRCRRVDSTSD